MEHKWWLDEITNNDPDQLKRQKSALGRKMTPFEVDHEKSLCYIKGSGKLPYTVTLKLCTCSDYVNRKKPCKHMYRLVYELGLLNPSGELQKQKVVPIAHSADSTESINLETGEIVFTKNQEGFIKDINKIAKNQEGFIKDINKMNSDALLFYYHNFSTIKYNARYFRVDSFKHYESVIQHLLEYEYIVEKNGWDEKIRFLRWPDVKRALRDGIKLSVKKDWDTAIEYTRSCGVPELLQIYLDDIRLFERNPLIEKPLSLRFAIAAYLQMNDVDIEDSNYV